MWIFDKLKSVAKAIVNAVTSFGLLRLPEVKAEQSSLLEPKIPIKPIVIPVAPKQQQPTEREIRQSFSPPKSIYANTRLRPKWADKCYNLFLSGEIRSTAQLRQELDSHRLLAHAKAVQIVMQRL